MGRGEIKEANTLRGDDDMPREMNRSGVLCMNKLCEGTFGDIIKVKVDDNETGMNNIPTLVAVAKFAKNGEQCVSTAESRYSKRTTFTQTAERSSPKDLLYHEACVMSQVGTHDNLVSMIGVVTRGAPAILIVNYCEHGSLADVLRTRCKNILSGYHEPFHSLDRLLMATDIAHGMEHLSSRGFTHGVLTAGNVLVDSQMRCLVSNFARSRATGDSHQHLFPIRWTAPEAIDEKKFTHASDVWSYGIVVMEIFTDAATPYPSLATSDVLACVADGHRIACPEQCPAILYSELVVRCWEIAPATRPTFVDIVGILNTHSPALVEADGAGKMENEKKVAMRRTRKLHDEPQITDTADFPGSSPTPSHGDKRRNTPGSDTGASALVSPDHILSVGEEIAQYGDKTVTMSTTLHEIVDAFKLKGVVLLNEDIMPGKAHMKELFFDLIFVAGLYRLGVMVSSGVSYKENSAIADGMLLFTTLWLTWLHFNMLKTRYQVPPCHQLTRTIAALDCLHASIHACTRLPCWFVGGVWKKAAELAHIDLAWLCSVFFFFLRRFHFTKLWRVGEYIVMLLTLGITITMVETGKDGHEISGLRSPPVFLVRAACLGCVLRAACLGCVLRDACFVLGLRYISRRGICSPSLWPSRCKQHRVLIGVF